MNKETKVVDTVQPSKPEAKQEVAQAAPVQLDPAILAAINAAVVGSVKAIVEQLKPATAAPAPAQAVLSPQHQIPYVPPYEPYKSKLQGIPVEPGQDLRHVPIATRVAWFNNVESRWKQRLKTQGAKHGLQTSLELNRGY